MIIRSLDFLIALLGLVITLPVLLLVIVIGIIDTGSPIFIQTRMGKNQKPFNLIKFRTMSIGTS